MREESNPAGSCTPIVQHLLLGFVFHQDSYLTHCRHLFLLEMEKKFQLSLDIINHLLPVKESISLTEPFRHSTFHYVQVNTFARFSSSATSALFG